jgi:hypothetical protein
MTAELRTVVDTVVSTDLRGLSVTELQGQYAAVAPPANEGPGVVVQIVVLVWRPIQAHLEHDDQYERWRARFPDEDLSAAEMPFTRDRLCVRLHRRKARRTRRPVIDRSIGAPDDDARDLRPQSFCRS